MTCSDGIQNQGEDGVDCGGPCSSCATTTTTTVASTTTLYLTIEEVSTATTTIASTTTTTILKMPTGYVAVQAPKYRFGILLLMLLMAGFFYKTMTNPYTGRTEFPY